MSFHSHPLSSESINKSNLKFYENWDRKTIIIWLWCVSPHYIIIGIIQCSGAGAGAFSPEPPIFGPSGAFFGASLLMRAPPLGEGSGSASGSGSTQKIGTAFSVKWKGKIFKKINNNAKVNTVKKHWKYSTWLNN